MNHNSVLWVVCLCLNSLQTHSITRFLGDLFSFLDKGFYKEIKWNQSLPHRDTSPYTWIEYEGQWLTGGDKQTNEIITLWPQVIPDRVECCLRYSLVSKSSFAWFLYLNVSFRRLTFKISVLALKKERDSFIISM